MFLAKSIRSGNTDGVYGPCNSFEEGISITALLKAAWLFVSRGFGYFVGASFPLKPKSGEGPPPWLQRAGSFCVRVHVSTEDRTESALVGALRPPLQLEMTFNSKLA